MSYNANTPVAVQSNLLQSIKKEEAAQRKWREKELAKQRNETSSSAATAAAARASVSEKSRGTPPSSQNNSATRDARDAVAAASLARFPPRRDRTVLLPLDAARGALMPELPAHLISRKAEMKAAADKNACAVRDAGVLSETHELDAVAFQSTNRTVYRPPVQPHATAFAGVNNSSSSSSSSSAGLNTQRAVMMTNSRDTNYAHKQMIMSSFFRKFGTGLS